MQVHHLIGKNFRQPGLTAFGSVKSLQFAFGKAEAAKEGGIGSGISRGRTAGNASAPNIMRKTGDPFRKRNSCDTQCETQIIEVEGVD